MSTREERRRALVLQFQAVAVERLAKLSRAWVQVEQERGGPQTDELFRELHTLKGEARAVGYRAAAEWLHRLETLLGAARRRGFPFLRQVTDAMMAVLDGAGDVFSRPPEPEVTGIPPRLGELMDQGLAALEAQPAPPAPAPPPASSPASALAPAPAPASASVPGTSPAPTGAFVRVARAKLEALSELSDQLLVSRAEAAHAIQGLRASAIQVEDAIRELAAKERGLAVQELAAAARALVRQTADHEELVYRQGLSVDALDGVVRGMRFIHASSLLDAYPRYVREIALASGKLVRLQLEGEGVEADKRVLDILREPLLHLVRNAVDHGIEPVEERVKAGKPAAGIIRLAIAQRGGRLTLEAEDDGRGIDAGQLKARAIELGMLTPVQAGVLKESEALDLIFAPGFSMRALVDETSGRGLGMDVVKRRVEQIGGRVELESRPGQGTRIRLTAPLSVSVTRALLLEQGPETYAVPAASVDAVRRVTTAEVTSIPGGRVLRHGDALLPVRRLWEEVRGSQSASEICVVLRSGQDRVALLADGVSREADLIIRPIEAPLGSLPLIAGAALLGSGKLVLLLEPSELVRGGALGHERAPLESRRLQILLVEDSVIFQATIADLLRGRGHRVALASNGAEGLERAASVRPDLVITDIEMPRMDGLQLIRALRGQEELKRIPVITLSALTSAEARHQAMESGANEYLVKSDLDEERLLDLVLHLTA